ncbi:MAG TPA: hypothetical protein VES42_28175 [Pilimelia sp.]|nr:hypothetical protein [Pilimelia sp.]
MRPDGRARSVMPTRYEGRSIGRPTQRAVTHPAGWALRRAVPATAAPDAQA